MNARTDMIMEGIICKYCGEFLDGESPGYERSCGCTQENTDKKNSNGIKFFKRLFKKNS